MPYSRILAVNVTRLSITSLVLFSATAISIGQDQAIPLPCADALAQGAVCEAANEHALELLRAAHLHGLTVMQNVRTGALVTFAATDPARLDVSTLVLPLSLTKLFLAASWWDHQLPEKGWENAVAPQTKIPSEKTRASVHEMLVDGSDSRGRQLAVLLRQRIGAAAVIRNLESYGFTGGSNATKDDAFWAELAPKWRPRLIPERSLFSLAQKTNDSEWADALSLGEIDFMVTGLQISRFLQAVGNGGVMLAPVAREAVETNGSPAPAVSPFRLVEEETTQRLQSAMRDTVQRGTARPIAKLLADTGWSIGGKTGTGPGPEPISPKSDGWFAGLVFDPQGRARYTVATFIQHGGRGGGNAARISAELARYIISSELPP